MPEFTQKKLKLNFGGLSAKAVDRIAASTMESCGVFNEATHEQWPGYDPKDFLSNEAAIALVMQHFNIPEKNGTQKASPPPASRPSFFGMLTGKWP